MIARTGSIYLTLKWDCKLADNMDLLSSSRGMKTAGAKEILCEKLKVYDVLAKFYRAEFVNTWYIELYDVFRVLHNVI